ncbi:MAG: hypothetical protein Edafosvirus48_4 [Edafosvirus sp.]|uniref:Uncharacterized protein n=1 Tax=Edafosvirus sp. TaxID=2487765 RepID=A0A3G4ZZB0_9VIRU|nr:MAG: hypothetical protein Edafosvirus48_4 [Edafosvirus sp.]
MQCNYGGGYRTLCDKDECIYCLERSFESHDKSKHWSKTQQKSDVYKMKKYLQNGYSVIRIL